MKKIFSALVSSLVLPATALAQAVPPGIPTNIPQTNITRFEDILVIISRVVGWIQALFFLAATVAIFYAAYLYLTAAGDEEKFKKAKDQFIYAVVAIAIALLSGIVPTIIGNFLQR